MRYLSLQEVSRFQHQASGQERLAALATFLDAQRADGITLGFWFGNGRGCAVGLAAATEPWFRAQGLHLEDIDRPALCRPVYREVSDWEAVAAFFDLSLEDCRDLFSAAAYKGDLRPLPSTMAERIRGYLAACAAADSAEETPYASGVVHEAVPF